jgi:hypothetical protein
MPEVKTVELEHEDAVEIDLKEDGTSEQSTVEIAEAEVEVLSDDLPSEEELESYSSGVRKRIDKLTAKYREAERREEAALQYARSIKAQNDSLQQQQTQLSESYGKEYAGRVSTDLEAAKKRYSTAYESGDVEELVNATQDLSRLSVETATLQNEIPAFSGGRQVQAQPTLPPSPPPDPKAQAWAGRNDWFGADEPMTFSAFAIHKNCIERGYDPTSDVYYQEIDRRIREEFPHKFTSDEMEVEISSPPAKNGGRSSVQRVASASRAAKSAGRNTVKLTSSQVTIAKKLGVPLDEYARQVKEIQANA